mmetsp:Transcript_216/g.546  ORF Transcript_216/g.546 Transcript_216/m.546 type:complete len:110 (-) Transcript_216:425-754(-)
MLLRKPRRPIPDNYFVNSGNPSGAHQKPVRENSTIIATWAYFLKQLASPFGSSDPSSSACSVVRQVTDSARERLRKACSPSSARTGTRASAGDCLGNGKRCLRVPYQEP